MLINGKANFAKIVGAPVDGYGKAFKEWTFNLIVDSDRQKNLKKEGLGKLLKETKDGEVFIKFRRKELNSHGEKNDPIEIIDQEGKPWNGSLIGNGSVLNVSFNVIDLATGPYLWVNKIQVWDHVPYGNSDEFPIKTDESGGELWNDEEAA